jgi:hypothetical protein
MIGILIDSTWFLPVGRSLVIDSDRLVTLTYSLISWAHALRDWDTWRVTALTYPNVIFHCTIAQSLHLTFTLCNPFPGYSSQTNYVSCFLSYDVLAKFWELYISQFTSKYRLQYKNNCTRISSCIKLNEIQSCKYITHFISLSLLQRLITNYG